MLEVAVVLKGVRTLPTALLVEIAGLTSSQALDGRRLRCADTRWIDHQEMIKRAAAWIEATRDHHDIKVPSRLPRLDAFASGAISSAEWLAEIFSDMVLNIYLKEGLLLKDIGELIDVGIHAKEITPYVNSGILRVLGTLESFYHTVLQETDPFCVCWLDVECGVTQVIVILDEKPAASWLTSAARWLASSDFI